MFPTRTVSNARFIVFMDLVYFLAHTPLYTTEARINLEPPAIPAPSTVSSQSEELTSA